ncbi:MAG: hypothetical protein U5K30_11720 [Acidimicrobiales bacterium]|nr:hypothetical protein [Acidimicrobiales bacterium]
MPRVWGRCGCGLVATKGRDETMTLRGDDGTYADQVLLDLDTWVLCPI